MSAPAEAACNLAAGRAQSDAICDRRVPPLGSLGHHHLYELLVVDLAIAVDVCFPDHLINLLISELLTQVCHDMAQLRGTDKAVAVAVEDLEGLDELLFGIRVLHLPRHEG